MFYGPRYGLSWWMYHMHAKRTCILQLLHNIVKLSITSKWLILLIIESMILLMFLSSSISCREISVNLIIMIGDISIFFPVNAVNFCSCILKLLLEVCILMIAQLWIGYFIIIWLFWSLYLKVCFIWYQYSQSGHLMLLFVCYILTYTFTFNLFVSLYLK